ncbi:hypothetical protein [Butyrivibrio sp.]|jgi:hypothetical protein|uniref:hypothetical protein n=1 Tax=Butyrivibrio sp. TaxID=28121 RepID=UPI0025BD8D22|nr:hypothetical protein [Butyrivibrio sp.]MBE5839763.1 hypothetical protein [Butyrivibrio sp.]
MIVHSRDISYSGTYSALRSERKSGGFPYSYKVSGYGNTSNKGSLFDFASVTITEHMLADKYGTAITNGPSIRKRTAGCKEEAEWSDSDESAVKSTSLPSVYEQLKGNKRYYYHGRNVTDYELLQIAVSAGKVTVTDDDSPKEAYKKVNDAFETLVKQEARPKYPGSSTLYSEDGKYTFTTDESGRVRMNLIQDYEVGASLEDISNWIMSGTPNRNIETRYLDYLRRVDPDLYNRAQEIGKEVRINGFMEDLHEQGILSDKQSYYDIGLLGMMFGRTSESMRGLLGECKNSGNYLTLLTLYDEEGSNSLHAIRERQLKETSGSLI